jgi:hypothetical protein
MRPRPDPAARRSLLRLAALSLALVAAAGCTPDGPAVEPAPVVMGPDGAAAASSPASELQAGLTALLVERAYLVAAATGAVDTAGGVIAPASDAALGALDANSAALADLLGATYSEARVPLLETLRSDDRLVAWYAVARAAGDVAAAEQARTDLERAETARVIRRVVPTLDAAEVAMRLEVAVEAQLTARSYDQLHAASRQAAGTARLLAAGIALDRELGSPGADAAQLRAEVTGLLTEHVMLSTALARELRAPGAASASARAALDSNAELLATALGDRYPAARAPFLRSWRAHLARLERYAASRAAGGDATAERGLASSYPAELARLLAEHVRGLPAQSAQADLDPALAAQLAAMDAAADGSPAGPEARRAAVAAVLPAAALVSAAMSEDLQLS